MDHTEDTSRGISRRELLKRGAIVGGVTVWMTPVVQTVGMGAAYAQDVSPGCSRFCLKWEIDDNEPTGALTCAGGGSIPIWTNRWEELGRNNASNRGKILRCPSDGINDGNAARDLTERPGNEFVVYGSEQTGFWVAFPNDVKVADLQGDAEPWSAASKCGQGSDKWTLGQLTVEADPCLAGYMRVFVDDCPNGSDISHIELIVDFCPGGTV